MPAHTPALRDKLKPYLDAVKAREVTNRALAKLLGVSEGHVCRVLKALGVQRDPALRHQARENHKELLAERKAFRAAVANDPSLTLQQAARRANCSVRTLYRYRKK